jgi:hypothetical protein
MGRVIMASAARLESWRRYDLRRRSDEEYGYRRACRRHVESAVARGELSYTGRCAQCEAEGITVFHHESYARPLDVIELCHRCHRRCHPRRLPRGGVV